MSMCKYCDRCTACRAEQAEVHTAYPVRNKLASIFYARRAPRQWKSAVGAPDKRIQQALSLGPVTVWHPQQGILHLRRFLSLQRTDIVVPHGHVAPRNESWPEHDGAHRLLFVTQHYISPAFSNHPPFTHTLALRMGPLVQAVWPALPAMPRCFT